MIVLLTFFFNHGIRKIPCCARDAASPVLSQHPTNGTAPDRIDAIGFGQGKFLACSPTLLFAGSKLSNTRHGGDF
jgi:hypothetical protein